MQPQDKTAEEKFHISRAGKTANIVVGVGFVAEIILAVIDRFTTVSAWFYYAVGVVVVPALIVYASQRKDRSKAMRVISIALYVACLVALTVAMIIYSL